MFYQCAADPGFDISRTLADPKTMATEPLPIECSLFAKQGGDGVRLSWHSQMERASTVTMDTLIDLSRGGKML